MLEELKKIISDLNCNLYSPQNNIEKNEKEFIDLSRKYMNKLSSVIEMIKIDNIRNNDNVLFDRILNVEQLMESLDFSLEDGYDEQDKEIAFVNRYAHLVELSNNVAHCLIDGDKKYKDIAAFLFITKNKFIEKIITNAKGMENKGIIFGKKTDGMKNRNSSVFVLDLVRTGQLSWHIDTNRNGESMLDELDVPNYKYSIEKNKIDSNNKMLNSKLLTEHVSKKTMNPHCGIVFDMPLDHEMELETALDFYEEFLLTRNRVGRIRGEEIFKMASDKYPNISKEVYQMLINQIMEKEYGDFDRKELERYGGIYEDGRT